VSTCKFKTGRNKANGERNTVRLVSYSLQEETIGALLRADGHRRQSSGRAWTGNGGTGGSLHVHQLAAQSHDLGPLQLDDLGLLFELQLHHGVVAGRRRVDDGGSAAGVAVNAECRLKVVDATARLAQLTTQIVDLFDQRHVLLRIQTRQPAFLAPRQPTRVLNQWFLIMAALCSLVFKPRVQRVSVLLF